MISTVRHPYPYPQPLAHVFPLIGTKDALALAWVNGKSCAPPSPFQLRGTVTNVELDVYTRGFHESANVDGSRIPGAASSFVSGARNSAKPTTPAPLRSASASPAARCCASAGLVWPCAIPFRVGLA